MQRAAAYQLRNKFLAYSESRTVAGVWVAGSPFITLSLTSDADEVGRAVYEALAGSRDGVPHPSDWKSIPAERLGAAGMRSEADFMRGARLLNISYDGSRISLEPTKNGGTKGEDKGFIPLGDRRRLLKGGAVELDIGNAVIQMLATDCL
jgi:hypothetical protein